MGRQVNLIQRLFGRSPRILIVRGAYLGDFLMITPALRALRRAVPGATIGIIVRPGNVPLAHRYRSIDEVFAAPVYPGISDGPEIDGGLADFLARMRAWKADLVLQLNGGGAQSNPFALQLGAKITAGIREPGACELDLSIPFFRSQPERVRYLDVLALFGIRPDSFELDLPQLPMDDEELKLALPRGLTPSQLDRLELVGIHPGAKSAARRWPAERFAAVADRLVEEYGLRPVLIGGEEALAEAILSAMGHRDAVIDMTGRTDIGAMLALIRRLRLMIGNDSGPSHVAEATRTPSVVIYGASHPFNWGPLSQAWHRIVADWSAPCRFVNPDGCPEESSVPCLQAVTVEQVVTEARSLLACLKQVKSLTPVA